MVVIYREKKIHIASNRRQGLKRQINPIKFNGELILLILLFPYNLMRFTILVWLGTELIMRILIVAGRITFQIMLTLQYKSERLYE